MRLKYPDNTLVLHNDNYGKIGRLNSHTCVGFAGREKTISKILKLLPNGEKYNTDDYTKLVSNDKHNIDMSDLGSCVNILGYDSQGRISLAYFASVNNYNESPHVSPHSGQWKIRIDSPFENEEAIWLKNEVNNVFSKKYDEIGYKLKDIIEIVSKFREDVNNKVDIIEFKAGIMYERYYEGC